MDIELGEDAQSILIPLRATPKSGKNAVVGIKNGLLLVAVRATPATGEANAAVLHTPIAHLGSAKRSLTLVRGQKSREKVVRVAGISSTTFAALKEKLAGESIR